MVKPKITAAIRIVTAGALLLLVSGVVPLLVQGYAYFDMAQKAGGFQKIGYVITEAEPCEICDAAKNLAESQRSDDELPIPLEQIRFLKTVIFSNSDMQISPSQQLQTILNFPIPGDSIMLQGRSSRPPTPPPRVIGA